MINFDGVICDYTFAAANIDERDVLQDMTDEIHGLLIGDQGFIRPFLKEEPARQGIDFQTPLRKNRFIRKILAHTLGIFLNLILGNPVLHFDGLVLF